MFVLGSDTYRFSLDVLDYAEKESTFRQEKNQLLVSIELKNGDKASIITGGFLATHELSALGNWFGQVAAGVGQPPIQLIEPGLVISGIARDRNEFDLNIRMTDQAAPVWRINQFSAEPFNMTFNLTYQQMLQAARQLQELHKQFPTQ